MIALWEQKRVGRIDGDEALTDDTKCITTSAQRVAPMREEHSFDQTPSSIKDVHKVYSGLAMQHMLSLLNLCESNSS